MKILEIFFFLSFFEPDLDAFKRDDSVQPDRFQIERAQSGGHYGPGDEVYGDRWPRYPARRPIPPRIP